MIDMQMGAHDEIDIIDAQTDGGEPAHEGLVALQIPLRPRRPQLVVADAGVDEHIMMRRAHEIGLETEHQRVVLSEGLRRQPAAILVEQFRR